MTLQQILDNCRKITEYFDQKYPETSREFRILARLGKITEELGELNSSVHSELGLQRKEKQDLHRFEDVELEWADVFNTVILFAIIMNIDVERVLEERFDTIFSRYGIDTALPESEPNNQATAQNPVGRFMVAVGAVIVQEQTGKILLCQRAHSQDWHPDEWEITYGRIDQYEDPQVGLRREIGEEIGLKDIAVGKVLRVWHMYRGSKKVQNDLIGITYVCTTHESKIHLSHEHQKYEWVDPKIALDRIKIEGIRADVEAYMDAVKGKIS